MTGEQGINFIVVNEAIDRNLLREHRGSGGCTVREAESGLEALQKAEGVPDLIRLNIIMPGWDDLAVCRCLIANETFNDIPVIILSSSSASRWAEHYSNPFHASKPLARGGVNPQQSGLSRGDGHERPHLHAHHGNKRLDVSWRCPLTEEKT